MFNWMHMARNFPNAWEAFHENFPNAKFEGPLFLTKIFGTSYDDIYVPFIHYFAISFFENVHGIYLSINSKKGKYIPSISMNGETYFVYRAKFVDDGSEHGHTIPTSWERQNDIREVMYYDNRFIAEFATLEQAFKMLEEKLGVDNMLDDLINSISEN